jgi:hypothetical protein
MQSNGKTRNNSAVLHHTLASSKPKLLIIISGLIIAILAVPVIIPHISHPSMIYHIFLHIISLIIATFLGIVSILAYLRSEKRTRMLFITLGFLLLAVIETLYLFHATASLEDVIIPIVDVELSHIILLAMLTLFGLGILKVNK